MSAACPGRREEPAFLLRHQSFATNHSITSPDRAPFAQESPSEKNEATGKQSDGSFDQAEGVCDRGKIVPTRISFRWPGSKAITLYDACGKQPIHVPEYDGSAGVNNPAAYVRGSGPLRMKVKWRAGSTSLSEAVIWATGSLGGVSPVRVTFVNGESGWISMKTVLSLPRSIKSSVVSLDWKFMTKSKAGDSINTKHVIYTLNKNPSSAPVYLDLVKWTTHWRRSLRNLSDKAIADAILQGFASSGVIRYATHELFDTASILCKGGGMCGGMTELFFDACGTQGVHVARSCYILRDAEPAAEEKWRRILIYSPGLGNRRPIPPKQSVRADDSVYPCPRYYGDFSPDDDIAYQTRKVYEFFAPDDGHCINFLTYDVQVYLYDLSFGVGPFKGTFPAVPSGPTSGADLANFRKAYFNKAVDYMRGLIPFEGNDAPCAVDPDSPFLDVKTPLIPYDRRSLSLLWYTVP